MRKTKWKNNVQWLKKLNAIEGAMIHGRDHGWHLPGSRRRGKPWYRHRDPWKRMLKACGWWEPSPNDPTLTESELESAFYREAEKVLLGDAEE